MCIVRFALKAMLMMAILASGTASVFAASDWSDLKAAKKTKLELYMSAKDAADYKRKNAETTLFVDVRTPEELFLVGAPGAIDANVPFKLLDTSKLKDKKTGYEMPVNTSFVAGVDAWMKKKGLSKNDVVIVMCRSGQRSASAVNALADAGYTKAYSLVEGFEGDKAKEGPNKGHRTVNGWKNADLPWSYSLDSEKMYVTK